jgi:hypothetical protein
MLDFGACTKDALPIVTSSTRSIVQRRVCFLPKQNGMKGTSDTVGYSTEGEVPDMQGT